MKIISLISQKGGSGKTTLAVHLAVCAIQQSKAVVLIDLDPQGSAFDWYTARDTTNELAAIQSTAAALPDILKQAKKGGADLVIIDTAPHSSKEAAAAAKLSDFVLVPCRPARFDLKAIRPTFDIIKLTKTPAAVVMNVCPRGKLAEASREALRAQGFSVLDVIITQRVAFVHAVTDGQSVHEYEPEGAAAADIAALFSFIKNKVKL